jgi:hypothetical protein
VRRRGAIALLVTVALAAACGNGGGGAKKARDRDGGPAVEMVDGPGAGVEMQAVDEKEPNGTPAEAGALAVGGAVVGALDGETDVDVYKVTVGHAGLLKAGLDGIDKVDLMLELRNAAGEVLARSDRGPAKITEGIPNFPVAKGDYYLAVSEFVKPRKKAKPAKPKSTKGKKAAAPAPPVEAAPAGPDPDARQGLSPPYRLSVEIALPVPVKIAVNADEPEPNDDAGGAHEVLLGDTFRGYIGWGGDVDVWKLSLEGFTAEYSLDVDVGGVEGLALTIEILDGSGGSLIKRTGTKGGAVAIRNLVPEVGPSAAGAAGGGYYYAKVTADRSNPSATYSFKTSTRLLEPEEEIEPNDDAASATEMRDATRPYTGVRRGFASAGDVDCYLLEASSEDMVLDITVDPPAAFDAVIEAAIVGGASLAEVDGGKAGQREAVSGLRVPKGKSVLVTLKGKGKGAGEAAPYQLSWALSPGSAVAPVDPYEGDGPATTPGEDPGLEDEYE